MSNDYTPTTDFVRMRYLVGRCVGAPALWHSPSSDLEAEFYRWYEGEKRRWQAEALREAGAEFEATAHAWGKIAMIDHLRARAERIENEGKQR